MDLKKRRRAEPATSRCLLLLRDRAAQYRRHGRGRRWRSAKNWSPTPTISSPTCNWESCFKQDQRYDEASSSLRSGAARAARRRRGALPIGHPGPGRRERRTGLRRSWKNSSRKRPHFVEAHVSLATVYYRLKRKEDGDRERAIVLKLNAEKPGSRAGGQRSDEAAMSPACAGTDPCAAAPRRRRRRQSPAIRCAPRATAKRSHASARLPWRGRSSPSPSPKSCDSIPSLSFQESGFQWRIVREGDRSLMTVTGAGETLTVPLLWAFGRGRPARPTFSNTTARLYESRVSFYNALGGARSHHGRDGQQAAEYRRSGRPPHGRARRARLLRLPLHRRRLRQASLHLESI